MKISEMFNRKKYLVFIIILAAISIQLTYASTYINTLFDFSKTFHSVTRNKVWVISKIYIDSEQSDKKSYFNNYRWNFNQQDSSKFLVEKAGTPARIGQVTFQDNKSLFFSMPLTYSDTSIISSSDSLFNEGVKIICSWPTEVVETSSTTIKCKIKDPIRGEILLELNQQ